MKKSEAAVADAKYMCICICECHNFHVFLFSHKFPYFSLNFHDEKRINLLLLLIFWFDDGCCVHFVIVFSFNFTLQSFSIAALFSLCFSTISPSRTERSSINALVFGWIKLDDAWLEPKGAYLFMLNILVYEDERSYTRNAPYSFQC